MSWTVPLTVAAAVAAAVILLCGLAHWQWHARQPVPTQKGAAVGTNGAGHRSL